MLKRAAAGALVLAACLVALGDGWPLPTPQPAGDGGRSIAHAQTGGEAITTGAAEVRVAAQRLVDGRTEFALQQRDANGSWAERQLPSSRFFPADAGVGRWLASSRLTVHFAPGGAAESGARAVRVAARLMADGRMEFALQELEIDGTWSERRLPVNRFFPSGVRVGRWLSSSPVTISAPVTTLCETRQAAQAWVPKVPAVGALTQLPSGAATVVDMKLFADGPERSSSGSRVFADRFDRVTAWYIGWQIDLSRPGGGERIDLVVETSIERPDGSLQTYRNPDVYVGEGWTSSSHTQRWSGIGNPPSWEPGTYRVELTVEGETIARGSFEVVDRRVPATSTFPALYEAMPWVGSRAATHDAEVALLALLGLREADRGVSASLARMPWVREGPGTEGLQTLQQLASLTCGHVELVRNLVALPWLADGISSDEWRALRALALIAADNAPLAELVADYGWVRDDITELERRGLVELSRLARVASVDDAGAFAWVREGELTDHERWAIGELAGLGLVLPEVAAPLVDFEWLHDEITVHEYWFTRYLRTLAEEHPELARQLVALPWTHDEIERYEQRAVQYLLHLADAGRDTATAVALLQDLSPADAAATYALRELSESAPEVFGYILSHPTISDGITDQEAAIVSTLWWVHQRKQELIDTLLDPAQVTVEERVIELPASGEVTLTIIRTGPGLAHAMEALERAVSLLDQLMAAPLSTRQVTVLLEDVARPGATATNYGTHIAVLPEHDFGDMAQERMLRLVAHEVSHYYWHGDAWWIVEGIAEFIETLADGSIETLLRRAATFPCSYARSIAEIEALDPTSPSDEFDCFYWLGEALFRDLYHGLGDEFVPALRRLYRKSLVDDSADACSGTQLTVCHVEAAFKEGASEEAIAAVDMALDFWYGEREPE